MNRLHILHPVRYSDGVGADRDHALAVLVTDGAEGRSRLHAGDVRKLYLLAGWRVDEEPLQVRNLRAMVFVQAHHDVVFLRSIPEFGHFATVECGSDGERDVQRAQSEPGRLLHNVVIARDAEGRSRFFDPNYGEFDVGPYELERFLCKILQEFEGFGWTVKLIQAYDVTRADELQGQLDLTLQAADAELGHTMMFYGLGNHGGGPTKATIE